MSIKEHRQQQLIAYQKKKQAEKVAECYKVLAEKLFKKEKNNEQ